MPTGRIFRPSAVHPPTQMVPMSRLCAVSIGFSAVYRQSDCCKVLEKLLNVERGQVALYSGEYAICLRKVFCARNDCSVNTFLL